MKKEKTNNSFLEIKTEDNDLKSYGLENAKEGHAGAGEGLGQLAGTGMYLQYTFDRNKHRDQIEELIKKIR